MCPVAPLSNSHKFVDEIRSRSSHTVPNIPPDDQPDTVDELGTCLDTDGPSIWQFQILRSSEVWFYPHVVDLLELVYDGSVQGARDVLIVCLGSIGMKDEVFVLLDVCRGDLLPYTQQQRARPGSTGSGSPSWHGHQYERLWVTSFDDSEVLHPSNWPLFIARCILGDGDLIDFDVYP